MPRTLSIAFLCLIAVTLTGRTAHAQQDAEQMLQEFRALKAPVPDMARRDDEAYVQSFLKEREAFVTKRAALAKEFYAKFPSHPDAMDLMQERWITLAQTGHAPIVEEETNAALKELPAGSPARPNILYVRAMAQFMQGNLSPSQASEIVEEFIKVAPKDDRGGQLLYQIAEGESDSGQQTATYRRIAQLYPGSQAAQMAAGAIRRADGIGKPFELSFTDAISGKQISVQKDLKGKVVVIDFWATWCGPCVAEMPENKKLYAEYKNKGVEFIGISLDQPEASGGLKALKEFVAKNDIPWPQYYQGNYWQSEYSSGWGINSIPTMFIVDKQGKLSSVNARGALDKLIPELLAK